MPKIPLEVIQELGALQNQIWQTISIKVSETAGQNVLFSNPLTVATRASDMYAEISAPMMVLQFCFSSLPESTQVMLIPQDTIIGLAELITGEKTTSIDDNVVASLRPAMEAIIQGVCVATGQLKNETIAASGLTIRYQIFAFPPNLQRADDIGRSQVAISGEGLNGSAIWLVDTDTAHYLLGRGLEELRSDGMPFPQADASAPTPSTGRQNFDENHGLDRLLDIPLEISVELGRIKMIVRDVIELGTGSIIEIEKSAGEPVDVMVNGRLVARGEVVVIEDNFGVRVTEILNPQDRLNRLSEAA